MSGYYEKGCRLILEAVSGGRRVAYCDEREVTAARMNGDGWLIVTLDDGSQKDICQDYAFSELLKIGKRYVHSLIRKESRG